MVKGELWLRRSMRFSIVFHSDTTDGTMSSWETQVSPSEVFPAQPAVFSCDRHIRGLQGTGEIETDQGKFELKPGGSTFIPAGARALIRCQDRETLLFETVATPGGSEAFFDSLGFTDDEKELHDEARAVGIEMYWSQPAAPLPLCLQRLSTRIEYPTQASFSL